MSNRNADRLMLKLGVTGTNDPCVLEDEEGIRLEMLVTHQ